MQFTTLKMQICIAQYMCILKVFFKSSRYKNIEVIRGIFSMKHPVIYYGTKSLSL